MITTSLSSFNPRAEEEALNKRLSENNTIIKRLKEDNDKIIAQLVEIETKRKEQHEKMMKLIEEALKQPIDLQCKTIRSYESDCLWTNVKPGTPMSMSCPCPKCSAFSSSRLYVLPLRKENATLASIKSV